MNVGVCKLVTWVRDDVWVFMKDGVEGGAMVPDSGWIPQDSSRLWNLAAISSISDCRTCSWCLILI